jgi:SAM-dependent methyltransferase
MLMSTLEKTKSYVPEAFWNERYSAFDLTRSGHRDLPHAYNAWLYRRKRAVLRRALARAGVPMRGARVLEVGVGTGAYLDLWRRLGAGDVTGIDISGAAIDFLRRSQRAGTFLQADVTEPSLPLDEGAFDLVAALDVLYHVVDDTRLATAMRHIARALKPGGVLAMHDQFLHRASEHHGYIRWRSLDDWQRILQDAGFEILDRRPIFFTMIQTNDCASPAGAARMERLWSGLRRFIDRAPGATGAAACALDSALGAVLKEGPSMELVLARRSAAQGASP